ncbi:MAG TPA: hypothetical protein VGD29_20445, partial [Actinoplanes sp.]
MAVTIGWQLATPATRSAAVDAPGGAGGMGDAPARHTKPAAAVVSSSTVAPAPSVTPSLPPSPVVSTPVASGPITVAPSGTPSAPPTE